MSRKKQAKKIEEQKKVYFKENPKINKALKIFDISYEQYKKTLDGKAHFYNDSSTSPKNRNR
jgi:hypothetical protein